MGVLWIRLWIRLCKKLFQTLFRRFSNCKQVDANSQTIEMIVIKKSSLLDRLDSRWRSRLSSTQMPVRRHGNWLIVKVHDRKWRTVTSSHASCDWQIEHCRPNNGPKLVDNECRKGKGLHCQAAKSVGGPGWNATKHPNCYRFHRPSHLGVNVVCNSLEFVTRWVVLVQPWFSDNRGKLSWGDKCKLSNLN